MYLKTVFKKLIYINSILLVFVACDNNSSKVDPKVIQGDSVAVSAAIMEMSKAIDADPENAELYYKRAVIFYSEKLLDRALDDIDDAISLTPKEPLYHYYKGRILYAMNKTKAASETYEKAIQLKPDYEDAKMKLAELYYVVKEHQKSTNLLNDIIAANPANADALCLKGDNLRESKDTAKAIAAYQRTLEADPNYYDAAMQLGIIFTAKKDPVAIEYFKTALRLNPKSEEAYFGRAYYYQQTKQYKKALVDYRKVVSINPSSDRAYYNVGMINFDVEQYDEALRSWNICIEMNNAYLDAYYMRGLLFEGRKQYNEARLNYQFVVDNDPGYTLAQEGLKRIAAK